MELGTVLSVAQTLYEALQSDELKELSSVWGYESKLEDLERTASVVKAVLLDAESKREQVELSHQAQLWVDELRDVVFDADDLLDEFVTLAEQKKLMEMEDVHVFKKVRRFFSHSNPLLVPLNFSRGVKEIKNRLDAIANNYGQFGFKLDCKPIRRRRDETCSYIYARNIVGREHDKEKIVSMLLDYNVKRTVSFLTIVGIGGLGKTALAQLVYNDPSVEEQFPLRIWTCVAGEDQKCLDVKRILVKVLQSATDQKHEDLMGRSLEWLQKELQSQLVDTRFLIVLDDVWNENRHQWGNLVQFFMGGSSGSWVVVTTRSRITAAVVDGLTYELKGLSEEDSWNLFEMTAFGQGCGLENPLDLVKVGQEIVKKCANVPLAIRVVGSLLYGHCGEKWRAFQEVGIGRIRQGEDGIEPILKSSYLHLETPLRICFSYCALFPKDYVLEKDTLISLWMAQGYIIPLEEGQTVEDAGEEYFSVLLRRCFFQDAHRDEYGEVVSCKMHDLMHDIAQEVAGKEICTISSSRSNLDKKIRHLSDLDAHKGTAFFFTRSRIRTYFRISHSVIHMSIPKLIENWQCLRALDLSYLMSIHLQKDVSTLLHLRYLDLSGNPRLQYLPESIMELHNLQTLKLRGCQGLLQLPEDWSKLVNLRFLDMNGLNITRLPSKMGKLSRLAHLDLSGNNRLMKLPESFVELHDLRTLKLRCCDNLRGLPIGMRELVKLRALDITGCWQLSSMPSGMGKLSCLQILPLFVVSLWSNTGIVDTLDDLKALSSLNGHLEIRLNISGNAMYAKQNDRQGGYIRNKPDLKHVVIDFHGGGESNEKVDCEERLLEDLQPHSNLKGLQLSGYCGKKIPSWAAENYLPTLLPNLAKIHLVACDGLQSLTSFGKLSYLKSLIIEQLSDLEYIEDPPRGSCNDAGVSWSKSEPFFPSLEVLRLEDLPKLRGWWTNDRVRKISKQESGPFFPRLIELRVWGCPNLTYIPLCPTIERLNLGKSDPRLCVMKSDSTNTTLSVYTEDVTCLKSALTVEAFQWLERMEIKDDDDVESLSEASELFQRCSTSLHSLIIDGCSRLKSVCGGLLHLTSLVTLSIVNMPCLNLSDSEDTDDGMPWRCLKQHLFSLSLENLPKLVSIPMGMRHLSSMEFLVIKDCARLRSLPKFMRELVSLVQLEITGCSRILKQRCQKHTGEDWRNIQHIRHVFITQNDDTESDEDNDTKSNEDNDSNFSSDSSSAHCL